jgi:hypothetical protein
MTSMTSATVISPANITDSARIEEIAFINNILIVRLNDGRAIQLDMARFSWLHWLLDATAEERTHWEIVPSGGGVWWSNLDNGIELQPLLDSQTLSQ